MSYRTFFTFAVGLKSTVIVPKGTAAHVLDHVAKTAKALGLVTEQYLGNPPHWTSQSQMFVGIDDETVCREVEAHNTYIRGFYEALTSWTAAPPTGDVEELTPQIAATFWHGLQLLHVPPDRWTEDYYRARMEAAYEVMRGREAEGTTFDAQPLTERQAAAVIILFAEFLDTGDLRLDVPRDRDYLASSTDGGYRWCSDCGAIAPDDLCEHLATEDAADDEPVEDFEREEAF